MSHRSNKAVWTKPDLDLLRRLWPTAYKREELLKRFPGRSYTALQQKAGTLRIRKEPEAVKAILLDRPQTHRRLAWEAVPKFNQFERLHGDFAISSDWHINKLDPDMLRLKAKVAKQYGITRAIIVGDLFDQEEFSHWVISGMEPAKVKFGDELVYAAQAFEEALVAFPDGIWITSGNHDERILRLLRFALELSDIFSLIGRRMAEGLRKQFEEKVKVSPYPFCTVNDTWYVCHPSCYSKIPCAVARDVAETEHMNTAMAGGHLWGLSKEKSGQYYCVDLGCMCDPLKTRYKVMRVKRFPKWTAGFMMLKEGMPYLFDREMAEAGCSLP